MIQEDVNEVISKSCPDRLSRQTERTEENGLYEDRHRYFELLYAVSKKYPGETRHQTALRILRAADAQDPGQAAKEQKNG